MIIATVNVDAMGSEASRQSSGLSKRFTPTRFGIVTPRICSKTVISMLAIVLAILLSVTILAGIGIDRNVRATNERIGYKPEAQSFCQFHISI